MICLYAIASLVIGIACANGYPHDNVALRAWWAILYAIAWPVVAIVALWCLWRMEDLDW